jgi:quercetin dioxygenase-like cupin family protein
MLDSEILDLFGPTIQRVIPLSDENGGYCLLKGTVPPGIIVPLHSHSDRETFYVVGGQLQALKGDSWHTLQVGDVFDVPGGARHAFRNLENESASILIVTTTCLTKFLLKIGRPIANVPPGPPSSEVLQRFAQASLAEGHWLGSVSDNAAVGINLLSFN